MSQVPYLWEVGEQVGLASFFAFDNNFRMSLWRLTLCEYGGNDKQVKNQPNLER